MGLISKIFPRLSKELGNDAAFQVVQIISEESGGFMEYIETTTAGDNMIRNRLILAEFDGRNYNDLAKKYSLTSKRIRQILSRK